MADREIKLGNLNGFTGGNFAGNVYDKNMLSPTISTMSGGGQQPMIVEDISAGRIVGRNPDNPTDRTVGIPTEQRLELNDNTSMCNSLTTVQKDNVVVESCRMVRTEEGERLRKAYENGEIKHMVNQYRIRKLTEKETWRLMGYKDSDFNKAAECNSRTQLYKQAGNAIVKQVLMAIFLQMGIQGKKRWNDMSVEERQNLVNSSLDFV